MRPTTLLHGRLIRNVLYKNLKQNFGASSVFLVSKPATDPIQKLFLDKLHEYTKQSQAVGGMVGATSGIQKEFDDALEKVKKRYGADKEDMEKLPLFSFPEPKVDPINLEK